MNSLSSRQQCLGELGVAQWYPRYRFPGAMLRPSTRKQNIVEDKLNGALELPIVATELNETSNVIAEVPAKKANEKLQQPVVENVEPKIPLAENSIGNTRTLLTEFGFKLYRAGNLLITSESGEGTMLADELLLLRNILKLIAVEQSGCAFEQSFGWPVFYSTNIPINQDDSLNKMFDRWLSRVQLDDIEVFLHFGHANRDLMARYLEGTALEFISLKHSLAEMLLHPERKAQIWENLPSNIKRLTKQAAN